MSGWDFDISRAPRGETVVSTVVIKGEERVRNTFKPAKVILATKCGKVTLSHWLPEEKRWLMLAHGEQPVAFMNWPKHPDEWLWPATLSQDTHSLPSTPSGAVKPAVETPKAPTAGTNSTGDAP